MSAKRRKLIDHLSLEKWNVFSIETCTLSKIARNGIVSCWSFEWVNHILDYLALSHTFISKLYPKATLTFSNFVDCDSCLIFEDFGFCPEVQYQKVGRKNTVYVEIFAAASLSTWNVIKIFYLKFYICGEKLKICFLRHKMWYWCKSIKSEKPKLWKRNFRLEK